jgi:hypothetical protein
MDYENYEIKNIIDEDMMTALNKMTLLICCNSCSEMLFTNQEISSFYIKTTDEFYIMVDVVENSNYNVSCDNKIISGYTILEDKDLGYALLKCLGCSIIVGVKIATASIEKFFMINKFLFSNKEVYALGLDKQFCYNYDLKQLLNKPNVSNSINDANTMIRDIEDKYSQLLKDFEDVQDYKSIVESLEDAKEFIGKLTTIARINKLN